MKCPKCGGYSEVIDSRPKDGTVYRRRSCLDCGHRFTTYEMTDVQKARYERFMAWMDATKEMMK